MHKVCSAHLNLNFMPFRHAKFRMGCLGLLFLLLCALSNSRAQVISLNHHWSFSIDPLQRGEASDWHQPWKVKEGDSTLQVPGFDLVKVPHTWSLDRRYNIVGKAWYRKAIRIPKSTNPLEYQLHFEAVFQKARIFINGTLAGLHEGGYTPFDIPITRWIKTDTLNFISIEVDNSWDEYSLAGARITDNANAQVFPWYEYGGLIRGVELRATPKVWVVNQKIESRPNLPNGTAKLTVITWIQNAFQEERRVEVQYAIAHRASTQQAFIQRSQQVVIPAYTRQKIVAEIEVDKRDCRLWDFDQPHLYDIQTSVQGGSSQTHAYQTYFGIRSVEVKGTALLLNGKPIRVAGANRQSDHPVFGSEDPASLANQDMQLLREGQMIFSRLSHTPLSRDFFKWADEHGYLIVAEISNWQLSTVQMASQRIKDAFEAQMREMVEAFWNSPSIIGYSTGNEYASWTPEGDAWTKYQIDRFRALDSTRLYTFVAIGTAAQINQLQVAHNSFRHCDFLNFNNYSQVDGLVKNIENLHQKFPDKPIFVSETGMRADQVENESVRIKHLEGIIETIRQRPYVIGFAYWAYNDYLSRYSGTNINGHRPWGLVDEQRNPRALYRAFQQKLSPVRVQVMQDRVQVTGVSDFPSYPLQGHRLRIWSGQTVAETFNLPVVEPGQSIEIKAKKLPSKYRITIENQGGICIYDSER